MWNIADITWNVASVVRQAFSAPWSGSPAQWLMVYTGLCFLVVVGIVLYVWRHDGGEVVRQRFRDMPRQIALAQAQRGRQPASAWLINLVMWIVIGLVLAVYLNGRR